MIQNIFPTAGLKAKIGKDFLIHESIPRSENEPWHGYRSESPDLEILAVAAGGSRERRHCLLEPL